MILRLRISLADAASWISFSCVDDLGDLIDFWDLNEKMEVEKRSSKGGFLHLFDWNVKSRKKLFSGKFELSDNPQQGKETFDDTTISRLRKAHDNGCGPSTRGNDGSSYASSVNGDEIYGTRAPGVVARLMGLDTLPTSNVSEPCYTQFFDSRSFRDSHYSRGMPDFRSEEHIIIYDSMRNKLDGFTKNPVEVMLQKVQNRPIEKFQTEVLPPKSAKPISITHHKLLSPIKSPGFIPSMNAAYLVEAAAKIIEQSPRSTARHKLPSLGSSSVPLRIQDLKEKMEVAQKSSRTLQASQKAKEQSSSKQVKRQTRDRVQGQGEAPDMFRVSDTSRNAGSQSIKNKEKSVSLAVQAKANVQKKEGCTAIGNRSSVNHKEPNDVRHSSSGRNQSKIQKNVERRTSTDKSSDVLRQNNRKQNFASAKEMEGSRPPFCHQKDRKQLSSNDVSRPNKTVNKIVVSTPVMPRKTSIHHVGKEQLPSAVKRSSGKKQPINGNNFSHGNDNQSVSRGERSIKCNYEIDRCSKWDAAERKNGTDVVSFTFTSPIKKSLSASSSPVKVTDKKRGSFLVPTTSENQSSFGLNVDGGDALSILLEQKLKELTSKVDSSNQDHFHSEFPCSSAGSCEDSVSTLTMTHTTSGEHHKNSQLDVPLDKLGIQPKSDSSSIDELHLKAMQKWQEMEELGFIRYDRDPKYQSCGPVSSLEPAYSESSCNSLDSNRSISSEASKMFLAVEAYEMTQWSSTRKSRPVEADMEVSDSASSASLGATSVTDTSSSFTSMITNESANWELEYIRCILVNTDLLLEEFALGEAHKVLAPNLFDQWGEVKLGSSKNVEKNFKLVQKVLFDYVEESLELKCVQLFSGSWKSWTKLAALIQKKDWLAEELGREISGWTSMEDLMVDELVDKDMSTKLGKWVDFEIEAFEEGVEIEKRILSNLVDELVDDFLLF
ncbi:uncharacterized protein LOC113764028 isoform X2 [Coffea eugenioides]|uniref:uncharacterized protein LOC113764028 isoform X2 n=1 Tax=Coffea eugenioides TaxID=49369 RepID=UPI000F6139C6|nr:uncharacterized protein LOC113764028 isoform X2 [Coffea eugenioides]